MADDNITSLNDYYHHHGDQRQQLEVDDEPFYELIKQPVQMVVVYTLAYSVLVKRRSLASSAECHRNDLHSVSSWTL